MIGRGRSLWTFASAFSAAANASATAGSTPGSGVPSGGPRMSPSPLAATMSRGSALRPRGSPRRSARARSRAATRSRACPVRPARDSSCARWSAARAASAAGASGAASTCSNPDARRRLVAGELGEHGVAERRRGAIELGGHTDRRIGRAAIGGRHRLRHDPVLLLDRRTRGARAAGGSRRARGSRAGVQRRHQDVARRRVFALMPAPSPRRDQWYPSRGGDPSRVCKTSSRACHRRSPPANRTDSRGTSSL